MSQRNNDDRMDRGARLAWVRLADMKISPIAQREKLDQKRVERIARNFDPDKFDAPKCNLVSGTYWVVDGWHRTEAAKISLGDDQKVQCWVRRDLDDAEAADWSLGLNDYRTWSAFDRFRLAVVAGRATECDIDRIAKSLGLCISRDQVTGGIYCVGTLIKVYERYGPATLARTLRLIRDAYGDAGYEAVVVMGLALFCQRYNGDIDEARAITKLGAAHGGVKGLTNRAHAVRGKTGNQVAHCVAAVAVQIYNAGRKGPLPPWWKS